MLSAPRLHPPAGGAPAHKAHPFGVGDPQKEARCIRSRHAALFAAIISLFSTTSAGARSGCQTYRCAERVAMKKCSQRHPRWCVERAILTYRFGGWQAAWMRRIPGCESRWNPYAHNASGSSGLYQFMPSTWAGLRYASHNIYSAKWSSLAAALMVREGRTGEWVCS